MKTATGKRDCQDCKAKWQRKELSINQSFGSRRSRDWQARIEPEIFIHGCNFFLAHVSDVSTQVIYLTKQFASILLVKLDRYVPCH